MKTNFANIVSVFCLAFILISGTIDLNSLFQYANQAKPAYIQKDNTPGFNQINDKTATLGRVLFYDKKLSANNTIACASCHKQDKAFGDDVVQSLGLKGGKTGRHSMRLINIRFSNERKFFWDERAANLENQTTQPIRDHVEMGFSGTDGDPTFDALITKLSALTYYQELFKFAYGNSNITENRIQFALSQFIRSIQSFDSKYDIGRAQVIAQNSDFPNFTPQENLGKRLFMTPPNMNGAGCATCHRGDEFDIDPNSRNNGIIGVIGNSSSFDITNTRSPSLRDIVNPDGTLNSPLMHTGEFATVLEVINHYNQIPNNPLNTNLDPRLARPNGSVQNLNLSVTEKNALISFLETLTGSNVYTNEKWSNPFDASGNITLKGSTLSTEAFAFGKAVKMYPNPVKDRLTIELENGTYAISVYNLIGKEVYKNTFLGTENVIVSDLKKGIYLVKIQDLKSGKIFNKKLIKK